MKTFITLFFLTLLATIGFTQNSWTTQIASNTSTDNAFKLIKTQDGGYVTVLNRVDVLIGQGIEYNKIAIVKLDANGNIVFNKKINIKDSSLVEIYDFIELPTGELLLSGGMAEKQSGGPSGSLLIKTDALGDTLWTLYNIGNIGASCNNAAVCLSLIDFNNKFWTIDAILTGSFSTLRYFIYEYDYNGNLLNINYQDTMVLLTTQPRLFKDINDSVFVVADFKGEGFLPKKMDAFFNKYLLSQAISSGTGIASNGSILQAFGGGLYKLTGRLDSIWLHPASEYEFIWGAGTSQFFTKIKPTADGGYVAIGNTTNGIVNNIFLIKTDALGNKEFGEMYWSVTNNNLDVVQANDGGYVMLNSGSGEFWVVKSLQDGTIGIDENNFLKNEVTLYPNPANKQVTLKFNKPTTAALRIYSITGKLIITEQLNDTKIYQADITALSKGIYIVNITTDNKLITKKLVVSN